MAQREVMECDVVIVGAGPAGLSAAIRLRQRAIAAGRELSVMVVEKGSEVGAHILSGAVLEPRALNELLPDWKERGAPLTVPVREDEFLLLTRRHAVRLPAPPQMNNHGNYIISLGQFCRWLAQTAEALGVQIFPGFAAVDVLEEQGRITGIVTGDFGVDKQGAHKPSYQQGIALKATYTLFAEGCRGSLAQKLMRRFELREGIDPQTYGIGIKEVWQVDPAHHREGLVQHTVGWPLDAGTYGGAFLYHAADHKVAVGFVTGLDYRNPYLDPFQEFQRFKTHPRIRPMFEGAKRLSYGARALNEGGFQSIPSLIMPGAALIGCSAGFMNVPKIKGTHTAMQSGICAADAAFDALQQSMPPVRLEAYPAALRASWVWEELRRVRNIRPAFRAGLWAGLLYAAIDTFLLRGRAPWTWRHHADHATLLPKTRARRIAYPKPDGVVTFDRLSSVYLSGTNHEENQPVHLRLRDDSVPVLHNLARYDAPEQRYCPAGVYEMVDVPIAPRLQINAQNCVHCKTCDIKDPTQNITWVPPEGGGGPNYGEM